MKLEFSGGAMEIGASCIYIRACGRGILMDSGIRQGGSKDPLPDFRTIQQMGGVDMIIVSHAHMDHTGSLPVISKAYPAARIYMTVMTADLIRVLLYDSLKIMDRREDEIPCYAENDVSAMLNRICPVGYHTPLKLNDDMTLTFYPAGHIAGAACVCLQTGEGTVFYSGDFCTYTQKTIEGIRVPKLRPDVMICETTYGDQLHANRQVEENRLIRLVSDRVRAGYKILIPAFALGRAQEVILLLKSAIQNGRIPPVPIYVDGMVRDINVMYERNPVYLRGQLAKTIFKGNEPFYTKEITPVRPNQNREELIGKEGAAVFVSSSGMLTGGPSVLYAKKIAAMERGCMIITGYQDEEAPGRKLMDLAGGKEDSIYLDGITVPVRCEVHRVGLSAHGDQGEIRALIERLSPRDLFLVHGEKQTTEMFAASLDTDYRRRVCIPECGQTYEVSYRNRRKQLDVSMSFSMQRSIPLSEMNEKDVKDLWSYVSERYPDRDLTASQLAFVWSGKHVTEDRILSKLLEKLSDSPYFEPNPRRLYLFHACREEDVQKKLLPRELTQQELSDHISRCFEDFDCKKISYHTDKKEVVLNFDYPDAIDDDLFLQRSREFTDCTKWQIRKNASMNHAAAGVLLREMFGSRILKTSCYEEGKRYVVQVVKTSGEDAEFARQFLKTTGWNLQVSCADESVIGVIDAGTRGDSSALSVCRDALTICPSQKHPEPLEQNMAFSCIEAAFCDQQQTPCKKSIKSDHEGKLIELAFLSPQIGLRYTELLHEIADQIQWRIRVADSVNQIEVFKTAHLICRKYDITLRKNPSYLPMKRQVSLKTAEDTDPERYAAAAEEFKKLTGLECVFE